MDRLNLTTLPGLAARGVQTPGFDVREVHPGIVHLGLGAFHRAHQALLTDEAMARSGDLSWGIIGVSQRSRAVVDQLSPQDSLYGVLTVDGSGQQLRIGGAIRRLIAAGEQPAAVVAAIAAPSTRVVTLTVTEKGYRHDPRTGQLLLPDPEIQADLQGRPPRTVVGQLAAGLQARHRHGSGPLTVICCDNLPGNGAFLRALVTQFTAAAGMDPDVALDQVRFPSSVVDRIVPATTGADLAAATRLTGVEDQGLVVAEPFTQWVLQDDFAGPRPAWHTATGVRMTDHVEPFEQAKLRVLNAAHTLLAYLGLRAGHATIAQAVADPVLHRAAQALIEDDALPTLSPPDGIDLTAYGRAVLDRFANPALPHTTAQVAQDGSQKLGPRLLGTAHALRKAGARAPWVALAVAAWALHVLDPVGADGRAIPLLDPMADELHAAVHGAPDIAGIPRLLALLDPELADDTGWVTDVQEWYDTLRTASVSSALSRSLPA